MQNKRFTGIMPALITPVFEDGTLREAAVRGLIDWQLSKDVKGFYICGSTGEGLQLSEETRMRMAEVTVSHTAGRGSVIAQVGASDALSAIRLAKHARQAGCDAISSLPPNYFRSYDEDEIFAYYQALGESCDLPLLAYATSMFKQPDISPFVARLMQLPTVIGLKFTRYDYYEMRKVLELNAGNINVINGPDEMLICGLTMGADAGIGSTYNIMPDRYVELYGRFARGDFEGARQKQFEINRIISVLIQYGVYPSIKHVLCSLGFDVGHTVFPGRRFTPAQQEALMRDLLAAGYTAVK